MAGGSGRRSDDDLEQRVRDVAERADPVPDAVVERARAAGRMPALESSDLLDLVYDSIVDNAMLEVPADERVRLLVFAGDSVLLALRLNASRAGAGFSGWTAPLAAVAAHLRTEADTHELALEADGTIVSPGVIHVPTSVLFAVDTGDNVRKFHTSWFSP